MISRTTVQRGLCIALAASGVLGACSSDSDPATTTGTGAVGTGAVGTDAASAEDFVAVLATNYALFDDDDQNTCIGGAVATAIGDEQFVASGVTPDDLAGVIVLGNAGLTIGPEAVPAAVESLAACGDLAAVSLDSPTATPEEAACAATVITNELAAEQFIVEVGGVEPSAELVAARTALQSCQAG